MTLAEELNNSNLKQEISGDCFIIPCSDNSYANDFAGIISVSRSIQRIMIVVKANEVFKVISQRSVI